MEKNHIKRVFMLLVSFGPGGAEKRFSYLFKHLIENPDSELSIDFYVNRTLVKQLPSLYETTKNDSIRLVQFGLPYGVVKNKVLATLLRRLDQLYLFVLLLIKYLRNSYDTAHFINFSALRFHAQVRAGKKVWSCFDSEKPQHYLPTNNSYARKTYSEISHIDCLDQNIANVIRSGTLEYNIQVTSSPCSFIDYSAATIGNKDMLLTYSGYFRTYKGISLLVEALKQCLESCPDLKVQLLGRGNLESQIRRELAVYIDRNRVEIGHVEKPTDKLKNSLIFVSLQQKENYPSQSLLEAMATANAVIATDVGLTHLLVNEDTGLRIDYNVDSLVNAIEYLYNNNAKARLMGEEGSRLVRGDHTVDVFWNYLRQIYLSLK